MCVMSVMLKMSMSVYAFVGKNVFVYDGAHVCFVVFFFLHWTNGLHADQHIYIYIYERRKNSLTRTTWKKWNDCKNNLCAHTRTHAHFTDSYFMIFFVVVLCTRFVCRAPILPTVHIYESGCWCETELKPKYSWPMRSKRGASITKKKKQQQKECCVRLYFVFYISSIQMVVFHCSHRFSGPQ